MEVTDGYNWWKEGNKIYFTYFKHRTSAFSLTRKIFYFMHQLNTNWQLPTSYADFKYLMNDEKILHHYNVEKTTMGFLRILFRLFGIVEFSTISFGFCKSFDILLRVSIESRVTLTCDLRTFHFTLNTPRHKRTKH